MDSSMAVILYFCKKYELDQPRTQLLLSELQSAQNMADLTLTPSETFVLSKDKVAKRYKRANNNNTMVIL